MITKVGLLHEPGRKRPWLVKWWSDPDPDTGKQRRRTRAFEYKRDAVAFQADRQAEIDSGERRTVRKDVTLGQLCDEFLKARAAHLSYKSQKGYHDMATQLREHFGASKLLCQIEQRHAERFMATRKRRDGRPGDLSRTTVAGYVTCAKAIFGAAVEWGYVARNPFVPAARPSHRGRDSSPLRVRAKPRPWQHIKPDEFLRFLAAVPDVRRRAAFWLMYGCGLRPGEVYNLTADKIDLPGREVHIENREATPDVPPFKIKCAERSDDSKERSVPIPDAAVPDVTEAIARSFTSNGFVLLTAERYGRVREAWQRCRRGEPWGPKNLIRPWQNEDMINNVLRGTKRALRRAGIELTAPFKLNTFRKSFAQNHADNGTPPKTLAKLLGHSDTQITMQFYNRVTDANVREAARTTNRLFATARGGKNAG